MSGYVVSPEDLYDLPVSHAHEEQRTGVEENHLDNGEGQLALLAPGYPALREQNRVHFEVRRDQVQHHQVRDIYGNG